MALGDSLWVQSYNSGASGVSPQEARLALSGQWATNSADPLDVRTGLVYTGQTQLLSGTAGLSVNVAEHHFLADKGGLNGVYLGFNQGPTAVTVPAAPSLGSKRIDLIYVEQQDANAAVDADASTQCVYGVVTGTPGASPSKPAVPAGTAEVGTVTWDSTSTVATATNAAQCTLTTTGPWTVSRGAPIPVRDATERAALTGYKGLTVVRLDFGGLVQHHNGTDWATISGDIQTGTVDLAGDATNQRVQAVSFASAFPGTPVVMLQLLTGMTTSATTANVWPSGISASGFTCNGVRSNATTMTVRWVAHYLG